MIKLISVLMCLLLSACAIPYPETPEGFTEKTIATKQLQFQVWEHITIPNTPIRIYIEGSGNPTPKEPIALTLAARDTFPNVVYVSQPCQYHMCKPCKNPQIWNEERFNEAIIAEFKNLVVYYANKYQAPTVELVGYDSGATIACLISERIPVSRLITIGGILDTESYAEEHGVILNGKNPMNLLSRLAPVPQVHYVAQDDDITPRYVAEEFVSRLPNPKSAVVKIVGDSTHTQWDNLTLN